MIESTIMKKKSLKPVGIFLKKERQSFCFLKNKKTKSSGERTSANVNTVLPIESGIVIPSQIHKPIKKAKKLSKPLLFFSIGIAFQLFVFY